MIRLFLLLGLSISLYGCGEYKQLRNWAFDKNLKQIVSDENEWRVAAAMKAGCTEKEIEEQLPVLTEEKVISRNYSYSSFLEAAKSFREDLAVMPCVPTN